MIVKRTFEEAEISFEPFMQKRNVMVNATEMAKVFGKRVDVFLKSDHAKEFIKELEFTPYGGNSEPLTREQIIQTKGQSGTWMHRLLALKFATWLSPKFELWVLGTIEELLFGFTKKQTDSIQKTVQLQREIIALERKEDKTGVDFDRYLKCQQELNFEKSNRAGATRSKFREIQELFQQNIEFKNE
jgi:hypothetical protein